MSERLALLQSSVQQQCTDAAVVEAPHCVAAYTSALYHIHSATVLEEECPTECVPAETQDTSSLATSFPLKYLRRWV
jgi:hypothetical protein